MERTTVIVLYIKGSNNFQENNERSDAEQITF
jgi:hypothetical protein